MNAAKPETRSMRGSGEERGKRGDRTSSAGIVLHKIEYVDAKAKFMMRRSDAGLPFVVGKSQKVHGEIKQFSLAGITKRRPPKNSANRGRRSCNISQEDNLSFNAIAENYLKSFNTLPCSMDSLCRTGAPKRFPASTMAAAAIGPGSSSCKCQNCETRAARRRYKESQSNKQGPAVVSTGVGSLGLNWNQRAAA